RAPLRAGGAAESLLLPPRCASARADAARLPARACELRRRETAVLLQRERGRFRLLFHECGPARRRVQQRRPGTALRLPRDGIVPSCAFDSTLVRCALVLLPQCGGASLQQRVRELRLRCAASPAQRGGAKPLLVPV